MSRGLKRRACPRQLILGESERFLCPLLPPDQPLSVLGKAILHGALALEKSLGASVPTIPPDAKLTGAEALGMIRDTSFKLFPGLRRRT